MSFIILHCPTTNVKALPEEASLNHQHTLPPANTETKNATSSPLDTPLPAEAWEDVSESMEEVPRPKMSPSPGKGHGTT